MMHNDEPTLIDALGRMSLIEEVGDAIAHCTPPQVFGIHGDWGLGKTSFLHQVQLYVTGKCPQQEKAEIAEAVVLAKGKYSKTIQAIWFDAWRYQSETTPIVALLQEMRSQLSWSQKKIAETRRNAEVVARGALLSIEELTRQIGFQYSKFRDANREWEVKNLASTLPSHTLRKHLGHAIDQLLPRKPRGADSRQPRLAIFIDDIDRRDAEVAYRLLEGLKIYLSLDNCVFVLGMNQKAVADAISRRIAVSAVEARDESLASDAQIQSRAAAYMEKLCQNVWQLPTVRDPAQVLLGFLVKTVEDKVVRDCIRVAVNNISCLPPNPRRLKGLANLIGRLIPHLPPGLKSTDDASIIEVRMLMIVAYIYQFHSRLYIRWEAEVEFYDRIVDWCEGQAVDIGVLNALVLPERSVETGVTPTPTIERRSTYPDPTETNVFWAQSLILSLGTEVTSRQFEPYLYGRKA